jgi:hypothetical protein
VKGSPLMESAERQDAIVERRVTYTLEMGGRFFVVENVPARVNLDTGEPFSSPQTVEQLQRIIRSGEPPVRVLETPVFRFAG